MQEIKDIMQPQNILFITQSNWVKSNLPAEIIFILASWY